MKQIDVRFSEQEMIDLQGMIGKRMFKYKCDPFIFSTAVYGIIGIQLENAEYAFTNLVAVMDYYGGLEDVALFKLRRVPFDNIRSFFQGKVMVETPVDSVIRSIKVVNERQRLYEDDILTYEVFVTRGVIFIFEDGHELAIEKDIWFSEDMIVDKGYNLIDNFTPVSEFEENWHNEFVGKCDREIITLQ